MDKFEFDSYIKAGEIAKKVKEFAREIIKPKMKLIDIAESIDAKILELGGEIAFPVNLGLNEIAAHFTPERECEEIANGILKVDLGICVNGFIADSAFSVDLSEDKKFEDMIKLNENILDAASRVVRIGMRVRDVGEAVQNVMDNSRGNFVVIGGLCGHGLGKNLIHTTPSIPNYRNDNNKILNNMGFAI
jgi:methionyl aminopeptidase